MLAMWRRPARVFARQLGHGADEARALAVLMAACLLMFLGHLPVLQRQAVAAGGDFLREASYSFMAWMMLAPLALYGLASLGRVVALAFRRRASGYGARLALFWALLSAAPAALLYGLAQGFTGAGAAVDAVGVVWLAAFLIFWTIGLRVAGEEGRDARPTA